MRISDWISDVCSSNLVSDTDPCLPLGADHAALAVDRQEADPASMLALTRRLVTLRAAHPALRCGDNAHWVVEGDLLAFDRIAGGETIRCLFNLGGSTIDLAARGDGRIPLVALNGAHPALLPPVGALYIVDAAWRERL